MVDLAMGRFNPLPRPEPREGSSMRRHCSVWVAFQSAPETGASGGFGLRGGFKALMFDEFQSAPETGASGGELILRT